MNIDFEKINYESKQIEAFLKEGKTFQGVLCHNCGSKFNMLNHIRKFYCKCGAWIKPDNSHLPFEKPDYGPPSYKINFAANYNPDNIWRQFQ